MSAPLRRLALCLLLAFPLQAATFTVTTTYESSGSLRQAILYANGTPGPDRIEFAIPGYGPFEIRPFFRLPAITDAVTIDATTQTVQLLGTGVRPYPVLDVRADDVSIDGLAIDDATTAIAISGDRATVRNCRLGLSFSNGVAILVSASATATRIEHNLISGNVAGIVLDHSSGNTISANRIGTDPDVRFPVPNETAIEIIGGASNMIGGDGGDARNIISGNGTAVRLSNGATGNIVRGNSIGHGLDEWMSIGNEQGVVLAGAHGNVIDRNFIHGTHAGAAITLESSDGNTIGGIGSGNTIDQTRGDAISILSGTRNTIRDNPMQWNGGLGIDLEPDGMNANDALDADTGPNELQNHPVITGGTADGPLSRVDGTLDSAPDATYTIDIYQAHDCTQQQAWMHYGSTTATTGASGHAQFAFSIDPNLLHDPLIVTATDAAGNTSEFSPCANVLYADLEVTGPMAAILEIGVPRPVVYTIRNNGPMHATNVIGVVSFESLDSLTATQGECSMGSCLLGTLAPGQTITMTATYRATSAERVPMYATVYARERDPVPNNWLYLYGYVPATFVVTSTADSFDVFPGDGICADAAGACTLRAATQEASISPAPDAIHFAIGAGPQTIALSTGSLYLMDEITIDGTTQPGYAGWPLITIDGSAIPYAYGFWIASGRATIRGLALKGFNVSIAALGGEGHTIADHTIGPDSFHPAAGMLIAAPAVTIERNVIAGHANAAVVINANDCTVRNNRIGMDANGIAAGSPFGAGIRINGASGTLVEQNTIAFNGRQGVAVYGPGTRNTIRASSIHRNGALGIDVGANGVTSAGVPVLTLAQSAGGITTVQGTLDRAPHASFVIELFVSDECDPSGYGEGETPVRTFTVTTDAAGDAAFSESFAFAISSPLVMTATATDSAGTTSEFSARTPVILNRPPVAICRDVTVAASASCTAPATAADVDAGSFDPDGDPLTMTLTPSAPFPLGMTSVELRVTDPSGSTSACEAKVTVVDETLPELTCPQDLEIRLAYGETAAPVTYDPPAVTDNCPATVVSCDIPTGSVLSAGSTFITCTATDASGNVATCTFRVTLLTAAAATRTLLTDVSGLVAQGVLSEGNGTALSAQLEAALRSLDAGNRIAAAHQLEAFIASVQALVRGGQLPASHGDALLASANAVLAQLA